MVLIDDAGIKMQGVPEEVLLPDLLEEVYGVSEEIYGHSNRNCENEDYDFIISCYYETTFVCHFDF
jgi:ABC-type cobalamin/Fe3+-siderophores transport system ATPase subunit